MDDCGIRYEVRYEKLLTRAILKKDTTTNKVQDPAKIANTNIFKDTEIDRVKSGVGYAASALISEINNSNNLGESQKEHYVNQIRDLFPIIWNTSTTNDLHIVIDSLENIAIQI